MLFTLPIQPFLVVLAVYNKLTVMEIKIKEDLGAKLKTLEDEYAHTKQEIISLVKHLEEIDKEYIETKKLLNDGADGTGV